MSTETLDERIRRAVIQVVETSPPVPSLDRPFAPFDPYRRRRRLAVVGLSLAVVLAIVLGGLLLVRSSNRPPQPGSSPGSLAGYLDVMVGPGIHLDRDVYTVGAGLVRVRFTGVPGHTFVIDDPRVHLLLGTDPGSKHVAIVTLHPGTYTVGDTVRGHRAAGEVATLHVLPQPAHWVTPSGSSTPITQPDVETPSGTRERGVGRALAREIHRRLPAAKTATGSDVLGFGALGRVGRVTVSERGTSIYATVYRLPTPVTADALTSDPDVTVTTSAGSQLMHSTQGTDVFLVRRDATLLHLSAVGAPNPTLMLELAERLDGPGLSELFP